MSSPTISIHGQAILPTYMTSRNSSYHKVQLVTAFLSTIESPRLVLAMAGSGR